MDDEETVVAVFARHADAEAAIRKLAGGGFPIQQLSIVGKGYHAEEHAVGFFNVGDRIILWGRYGAFWGGVWGLFVGGLMMTAPLVGPIVVLGHFGAMLLAAAEGAAVVGGAGVLAGALASIGLPRDAVVRYETAVKADRLLLIAHGSPVQVRRAKAILTGASPDSVIVHPATSAAEAGWQSFEPRGAEGA